MSLWHGKRCSQLEFGVTEESASHLTSAFEVEMQSATSENDLTRSSCNRFFRSASKIHADNSISHNEFRPLEFAIDSSLY